MIKTGIYGGSFNPIHCGHIALARQLQQQLPLDEVWFMVSPLNPFKQDSPQLITAEQRFNMVSKALSNEKHLVASDYEFRMPKPSYTWDTLNALSADYPNRQFVLLIGADNWCAFDRWYHYEDILSNYDIVIYPRRGCTIDPNNLPKRVTLTDTPLYDISSTEVRDKIAHGQSISGMIPACIEDIVKASYR